MKWVLIFFLCLPAIADDGVVYGPYGNRNCEEACPAPLWDCSKSYRIGRMSYWPCHVLQAAKHQHEIDEWLDRGIKRIQMQQKLMDLTGTDNFKDAKKTMREWFNLDSFKEGVNAGRSRGIAK